MVNLQGMATETVNANSTGLSDMSIAQAVGLMNAEDFNAVKAVTKAKPEIEAVIALASKALTDGGRIVYAGAGTSGRLGVLDAVECPPTFGVDYNTVVGLIAGGENAFVKAKEGAEDSREMGADALKEIDLQPRDMVIGIAASGRTPYVLGALDYAKSLGCPTGAIVCNEHSEIEKACRNTIVLNCGPEVLTGSTRLKAGTATKMTLNMISTIAMVQMGKVYKNYMVDVKMTNEKLRSRGLNILKAVTKTDDATAKAALEHAGGNVKTAIVMLLYQTDASGAEHLLEQAGGHIARIKV